MGRIQSDGTYTYTYDPWGKVLSVTNGSGTAITDPYQVGALNPLRYRGYYYDTDTQLYYLQSRYYDPEVSRFINADAAEFATLSAVSLSDTNLFAYCANDPANKEDPTGNLGLENVLGAVVGGVTNLVTGIIAGDSAKDIAKSVVAGAVVGFVKKDILSTVWNIYSAAKTVYNCYQAGASVGVSLLCGAAVFGASLISGPKDDLLADAVITGVFGLAASSAATTASRVATEHTTPRVEQESNYTSTRNKAYGGSDKRGGYSRPRTFFTIQIA